MNKRPLHIHCLSAFSVLEISLVLALMALLSALFFGALNRFGEQMHHETRIKDELNQWFVIRAQLWRELDEADSIRITNNSAHLFYLNSCTSYYLENELLKRKKGEDKRLLPLSAVSIRSETVRGMSFAVFRFYWKGEEMALRYPIRRAVSQQVNNYFNNKTWQ